LHLVRERKQNREYVRDLMTLITGSSENADIDNTQRSKIVSSNRKFEAGPQKSLPNCPTIQKLLTALPSPNPKFWYSPCR
jgi:hypothetical protein